MVRMVQPVDLQISYVENFPCGCMGILCGCMALRGNFLFPFGMYFIHVFRAFSISCFDYTNALADLVVGYMGVPKYAGLSMTQHPQYVTVRNERGKEMLSLVNDLLEITPTTSGGERRPFVMETVKADDNAKLGRGPSQPVPKFIGNFLAFVLNLIGPKGLEFARYSLDYHTIRNYLHVNRAWGRQRADRHIPSYAKKIVSMYNQNGEIDQMISAK
ncbi:7-hydroxymethyl chlorophyll a reductase [Abeliophyllum distichum]|uniref:7-hydroxymethyl chlorophyll a reductase n=1 Tax=Abeliophyllum distichum TaxID=126358 RepID=A0ABD1Q049_9LAMI